MRRPMSGEKVSHSPKAPHMRPLDAGRVFEEHADRVAGWASRLAGPALDVEDLVQEVFVIVQRRLDRFRGDASITTWLYGITANVVHQQRRRAIRRRWFGRGPELVEDEIASGQPTPLDELQKRRRTIAVYRVLDRMREANRDVLILFEIEGLSGEDI